MVVMIRLKTGAGNTADLPKFSKIGTVNLSVAFCVNSDPIKTRMLLAEKGLRAATIKEMEFFLNEDQELRNVTMGKWFRADLILERNLDAIYRIYSSSVERNGIQIPEYRRNWQVFRWYPDKRGNISCISEEDAPGIILKMMIGVDTRYNTGNMVSEAAGLKRH